MALPQIARLPLLAPIPRRLVLDANNRVGHHELGLRFDNLAFSRLYHVQHSLLFDAVVVVPSQVDLVLVLDRTGNLRLGLALYESSDVVAMRQAGVIVALLVCKAFLDLFGSVSCAVGKRVGFPVPALVCVRRALDGGLERSLASMISLKLLLVGRYLKGVLYSSVVLLKTVSTAFWFYFPQKFSRLVRLALNWSVATQNLGVALHFVFFLPTRVLLEPRFICSVCLVVIVKLALWKCAI